MTDIPNFAAWSNADLAQFAVESYLRMQEQQETIEQHQRDLKNAEAEVRRLFWESSK
jgi:hypothetical protein